MPSVRAVLIIILPLLLWASPHAQKPAAAARHVILISIDGLKPAYYLPSPTRLTRTPALDALRERGS